MRLLRIWSLLQAAAAGWWEDRAMSMGAALAFYTAFSLAPMLLLIIAVAGLVFGTVAAQGAIVGELGGLIGKDGTAALETMLGSARPRQVGIVGTVVGVITYLVLATGTLVELQDSLNRIWKAPPPARSGLITFLRTRLLSLALILAIGFLLLVSLALNAALTALGGYLAMLLPALPALIAALDLALSLSATTVLLGLIYKILPDVPIAWRDVAIGAGLTSLLFTLGKVVIGIYIGASNLASSFGAAAAVMAMLLWIYYSALIVLFGAEFTKAYAERHGSHAAVHRDGSKQHQ
jgi:membrane protein